MWLGLVLFNEMSCKHHMVLAKLDVSLVYFGIVVYIDGLVTFGVCMVHSC